MIFLHVLLNNKFCPDNNIQIHMYVCEEKIFLIFQYMPKLCENIK